MNRTEPTTKTLEKLRESGLALADPTQDIRGRNVVDVHGEAIGHVSALFIDVAERKVRMMEVRAGGFLGFGERHVLLPIDAVTSVSDHDMHVNETRERVAGSPAYDPELVDEPTPQTWEPYYGYYGLSPFWGTGYLYPGFPMSLGEVSMQDREPRPRD